jgi:peroxiredoxin
MDVVLIVAVIMPWALVLALTWFVYTLIQQHGRTLLDYERLTARVAALEAGSAAHPAGLDDSGLPVGSEAPDFALPDLQGRKRTLKEFLGRPLAVIFWSPTCGYCAEMAPLLKDLPKEPRVLLVSNGEAETNRQMAAEHKFACDLVLDTDHADVFSAYKAPGTPAGYLIDAQGRITSDLAVGAPQVLGLLAAPIRDRSNGHAAGVEGARAAGFHVRGIEASHLNREGLKAGTPAPDFSLPDLKGKNHSLQEFRGRRVLLVFSDPDCLPCNELASDLVELQERKRADVDVVMISRGDAKANREQVKEKGFNFPVLLQKGWKVSKDYAMFGTPIGYLIDEQGVIAKDPAVGPNEIRQLV